MGDFSKLVKDRLESLYAEYAAQALQKAESSFASEMPDILKKYADKITPFIFKSLSKFIFTFGKKF